METNASSVGEAVNVVPPPITLGDDAPMEVATNVIP